VSFFLNNKKGVLIHELLDNKWLVELDEMSIYCFHESKLQFIKKRILNLELDPYGEENWYE